MIARNLIRWVVPSPGILRVTAYGVFVFSVAALLAARVLYADVKEAAMSMGHELAQVADLLNGVETILVNGERMHHASTYVDQDVSTVLDRFETYCERSPSSVTRAMNDFPKELMDKVKRQLKKPTSRLGIVRQEADGRGMVACFVSDDPVTMADFKERLRRFRATRRLSEFGIFRYLFAERSDGRTHVVTTWADTGLDLRAMFPKEGDAAGADSRLVPRPPSSRRTMSAAADGRPYGVWIYESTERADAIRAFYGDFAKKGGLQKVEGVEEVEGTSEFIRPDGHQVFVSVGERDGQSYVVLTETGSLEHPGVAGVEVTVE